MTISFRLLRISFPRTLGLVVVLCVFAVARAAIPPPGGPVPSIAPMLERVTPAVVNISVMAHNPAESNPLL